MPVAVPRVERGPAVPVRGAMSTAGQVPLTRSTPGLAIP